MHRYEKDKDKRKLDESISTYICILKGSSMTMFWNEQIETMDRADLERLQLERFKNLVEYCYHRVPFYTKRLDEAGFPVQAYTVHILPPLFPDPTKGGRENAAAMREKNQLLWKEKYEEVYGIPLCYDQDA